MKLVSLVLSCWLVALVSAADDLVVQLKHGGKLEGSLAKSYQGKPIFSFRGIPYAEPPTGQLRFKAPVAKSAWNETRDATTEGSMCPQMDLLMRQYSGKEDCLFLNVYTPQLRNESTADDDGLPVMVFIHGGGFFGGNSVGLMYNAGYLADKDVILVTINYRLGALGFLATGDESAPGNFGLLDQTMALRWVKENIGVFGGDKRRVTIFGQSSGGVSVGLHLFSPMSSGLFHSVISQSGSPLGDWALQKYPLYWAQKLARDLNCSTDTTKQLISCLRNVPPKELTLKQESYKKVGIIFPLIFLPTVDGHFLTDKPRNFISSGKIPNRVPYMAGVTQEEGAFFYAIIKQEIKDFNTTSKDQVTNVINYMLDGRGRADEAADLIWHRYFSGVDLQSEEDTRAAAIKVLSHGMFDVWHYESVPLLAQAGIPTYAYSFDYLASYELSNLFGSKENYGVGHCAELLRLFKFSVPGVPKPTLDDNEVTEIVIRLWTNFAKNQNPNGGDANATVWLQSEADRVSVHHIDLAERNTVYQKDEVYKFWTEEIPQLMP